MNREHEFREHIVRGHGRYQVEVKLNHDFSESQRKVRYRVETCFFVPHNLDVNNATYSKNQFYRDRLLYVRLKTPEYDLAELADSANRNSPLGQLESAVSRFPRNASRADTESIDYQIRLTNQSGNLVYPFYFKELT